MGRLLGVLQGAAMQASFFPCLLMTGAETAWNPIQPASWLLREAGIGSLHGLLHHRGDLGCDSCVAGHS